MLKIVLIVIVAYILISTSIRMGIAYAAEAMDFVWGETCFTIYEKFEKASNDKKRPIRSRLALKETMLFYGIIRAINHD